jgi:CheY-like chemotaxis protein
VIGARRAELGEQLEDALGRLHDKRYLDDHPLGRLLAPRGETLDGATLQRTLLDAIGELRPVEAGPYHATDWRRYRHLVLRYAEGFHPNEVAGQLGVSPRQARRDHRDALEAVTALLWARHRSAQRATVSTATSAEGAPESGLDVELARFASASPEHPLQLLRGLEEALETVRALARNRGVTIEVVPPGDLPLVAANADALRQIYVLLLSAAIDWDAESRIAVTAENVGGDIETRVVVRRRVKGKPSAADRARLDADHGPSLRVAARLATMQGGSLDVRENEQGDLSARLRLKALRPATILVVDDNPDFVRLFRRYLSGAPYRVLEAKVPGTAVPLAAEVHPDVVMLDVMMPSQDGWQVLQQLKRRPDTRDIPVVVCSVLRESALALSLGATDFLSKPITQQALLACLGRHGGTSRAPTAHSAQPPRSTARPSG